MLLQSQHEHATRELLIIAAGLSIQDPRERPLEQKDAAAAAHKRFADPQSDFLSLLKIWNAVHDQWRRLRTQGQRPSYAEFAASSTKLTQKVNLVSTTVGMTSSPSSPSLVGQAVTFTVTLTAENGQTPTGTVTFYDGKTQLGTGPVTLSGGVAQYSTGSGTDGLSEGTHKIKAVYSGTAGDFATSSVTLTQKVVQ